MDYFHQIGSGPLFAAAEFRQHSTKACPECGDTNLVLLRSQNLKVCSNCKKEIAWHLDAGQKPLK